MPDELIHFQWHHFAEALSDDDARALFRTSVQYVEIELFTYCNRRCWFCPNASIPQRQDKAGNQCMPESLYLRILDELSAVNYCGDVQFGRYNEPLADRVILARIRQARERLPKAWLYTHTNGDFLTREYLGELRDAGLNNLEIQTYLGNDERYDESRMVERQAAQLQRLGLSIRETICRDPGQRHQHVTDYQGMVVRVDARNFDAIGTDRGGLLPIRQSPRTAPCLIPFRSLYVDWDGSVMPCCNLRSDVPEHVPYVAARLQDGTSIYQAFAALHGWRKSLLRFGPKAAPCATCRYDEHAVDVTQAGQLDRIYAAAVKC